MTKRYNSDFSEIVGYNPLHSTDDKKVSELKANLLQKGWTGMPILIASGWGELVTGSHRLVALKEIWEDMEEGNLEESAFDFSSVMVECVQDILDEAIAQDDEFCGVEYDHLRQYFAGTRIEQYKNDLNEW